MLNTIFWCSYYYHHFLEVNKAPKNEHTNSQCEKPEQLLVYYTSWIQACPLLLAKEDLSVNQKGDNEADS